MKTREQDRADQRRIDNAIFDTMDSNTKSENISLIREMESTLSNMRMDTSLMDDNDLTMKQQEENFHNEEEKKKLEKPKEVVASSSPNWQIDEKAKKKALKEINKIFAQEMRR